VIEPLRPSFGVEPVCRELGLSPSAYRARMTRPPSARFRRDQDTLAHIRRVHDTSLGTYGAHRIYKQLRREEHQVARCTVERLMREHGLEGVARGRKRKTTIPDPAALRPADLVKRQFTASRPDQLWVADITYVDTWEGWVYVAFITDVYSRKIIGWKLDTHLRTSLALDALEMAICMRRPAPGSLVHHSDRGCPVHLDPLQRAPRRSLRRPLRRIRRGLLRQRPGRSAQRHVQGRAHRPVHLAQPRRG
jgi:putative transposase